MSRDPIGENGGINLYGYVDQDPVNQTDPFGLAGACQLSGAAVVADAQANATNFASTHQCVAVVRKDFNEASGGNGTKYIPHLGAGGTPTFTTIGNALIMSGCYIPAPPGYTPKSGDVEITEGTGTGHVSIYTGHGWAADYTSPNPNPNGPGYARATTQIYEYVGSH